MAQSGYGRPVRSSKVGRRSGRSGDLAADMAAAPWSSGIQGETVPRTSRQGRTPLALSLSSALLASMFAIAAPSGQARAASGNVHVDFDPEE